MPGTKTKKSGKGKTKVGSSGLTSTEVRRFGQGLQMQVGSTTYVNPPTSSAPVLRGPVVRDFPGTFSYTAGYMVTGSATRGTQSAIYFSPALTTGTTFSITQTPIAPGDANSIATGSGFGSISMNALTVLFARREYQRITLCVEPFAQGATTTAGYSFTFAPVRGSVFSSPTGSNGGYQLTTTGTAAPGLSSGAILQMRGGVVFPSFVPMKFDLTPYIAGGSGPRQNEFYAIGVSASGDIASGPNLNQIPQLQIPCGFILRGDSGTANTANLAVGIVRVELQMVFKDWFGDAFPAMQGIGSITERKQQPIVDADALHRSTGSAASAATSLQDEKQPPPDQRGYWFSSKPAPGAVALK